MILDISDNEFKDIFGDAQFHLPICWDGDDFSETLHNLYCNYLDRINIFTRETEDVSHDISDITIDFKKIKLVCHELESAVRYYLDGFPSDAFRSLEGAMFFLMRRPLKVYYKSAEEYFLNDGLELFRVARIHGESSPTRSRVFHTPYNLRHKISTNRYSIAGYPSLYLSTSLKLCANEISLKPDEPAIASRFMLERLARRAHAEITVIELGIKPQDFFEKENDKKNRRISSNLLQRHETKMAYLLWYPLIAACSYIRKNKSDPFAAE